MTNAAREGARIAILPGYTDADVQARVTQYLTAGGLTGTATTTVGAPQPITVGTQCITVRPVTVGYQHQFLFLGPILGLMGGGRSATRRSTPRRPCAARLLPVLVPRRKEIPMNRRSRHLVVLTVAVVTAAIASFAVYRSVLVQIRCGRTRAAVCRRGRALDGHRNRAHRARREAVGVARG